MPCGSGYGRWIDRALEAVTGARLVAAISVGGALLLLAFRGAVLGSDPERLPLGPQAQLYDTVLWALVLFAPIGLGLSSRAFSRRFIGTAPPESLAFIRILCSGILFVSTLWEDLASTALLPAEAIAPPGLFALVHWLPGMTEFMRDASLLRLLETTTALLLLLGVLGFRTRWVLPLACIGYFLLGGILRQYAWFYHTGLVPLWLLVILSFTPCGDALSLDARRRTAQGEPRPRPAEVYSWSRFACWMMISVSYLNAGLSKITLGGLEWTQPLTLKWHILADSLRMMEFDWGIGLQLVHMPDVFFSGLAWLTLIAELGYPMVLFSRRARVVWPVLMTGMHLGICLLQNVFFFDLIALQLVFLSSNVLRKGMRWLGVVSATADTDGEPAAAMGSPRAIPAVAGVITALFLGACTQHLKFFPISAFPMYAHPVRDTAVYYLELKGRTRSGSIVDLRLEDEIHALADGRGRRILRDAFGPPATRRSVDELLKTWSELYNARVPADERLSQIAVQRRSWDFESNPDDPNYGVIIQRFVYQVQ